MIITTFLVSLLVCNIMDLIHYGWDTVKHQTKMKKNLVIATISTVLSFIICSLF